MKKILIIGHGLLLSSAIESLLDSLENVITRTFTADGGHSISKEIQTFCPQVIITESEQEYLDLYHFFYRDGRFAPVRLILLDAHENRLQVCEFFEVKVTSAMDLISTVESP